MLPSTAASRSGHWNHDGSRRWHLETVPWGSRRSHTKMSPRKPSTRAAPSQGAGDSERLRPGTNGAAGQIIEQLANESDRLLDLQDSDPQPRVDITVLANRNIERQRVIGRVAWGTACIEISARSTADVTAGAECTCKFGGKDSRRGGSVLQRGRIVVKLEEPRRAQLYVGEDIAYLLCTGVRYIARKSAWDDGIHHEAVAEGSH